MTPGDASTAAAIVCAGMFICGSTGGGSSTFGGSGVGSGGFTAGTVILSCPGSSAFFGGSGMLLPPPPPPPGPGSASHTMSSLVRSGRMAWPTRSGSRFAMSSASRTNATWLATDAPSAPPSRFSCCSNRKWTSGGPAPSGRSDRWSVIRPASPWVADSWSTLPPLNEFGSHCPRARSGGATAKEVPQPRNQSLGLFSINKMLNRPNWPSSGDSILRPVSPSAVSAIATWATRPRPHGFRRCAP